MTRTLNSLQCTATGLSKSWEVMQRSHVREWSATSLLTCKGIRTGADDRNAQWYSGLVTSRYPSRSSHQPHTAGFRMNIAALRSRMEQTDRHHQVLDRLQEQTIA